MKPLKKVVLVVLLLPVALVLVSLFLPSSFRVERSVTIKAGADSVFPWLNTLKKWPEWSAWNVTRYPDMKVSFSGPESGVGAHYSWEGKTSGYGSLQITKSDAPKQLEFDLDFEHGKYVSKGTFLLQPAGDTVTVIWRVEGALGWNPVMRVFGLLMDKMMGADLETGLRNLRDKTERKQAAQSHTVNHGGTIGTRRPATST